MSAHSKTAVNIRTKGHWGNVFRAAVDRGGLPEAWSVFVRGLYRRIRIRLPTRSYAAYNGVTVLIERKLLDELVPSKWLPTDTRDLATYESALVLGIREHVRPGDRVVIVGGGWGVTTVVAAQKAGEQGSVITFEESSESVRRVRWAVETARRSPTVQVVHRRVDGSVPESAPDRLAAVRPEDLPYCEVLELDCEGAELVRVAGTAPRTSGLRGMQDVFAAVEAVDTGTRRATMTTRSDF